MILATHALTGAVIGKNVADPWMIVLFALAVHFTMDSFRHGEYVESFDSNTTVKDTWWKILLDLSLAGSILIFWIWSQEIGLPTFQNVALGIFFSLLPDGLTVLFWKFKLSWLAPVYRFHDFVHRSTHFSQERAWTLRNARNDIFISALAIIILFYL
jgi:hypothetical protein